MTFHPTRNYSYEKKIVYTIYKNKQDALNLRIKSKELETWRNVPFHNFTKKEIQRLEFDMFKVGLIILIIVYGIVATSCYK